MGNINSNAIQPQIISANLVPADQAAQEIEKAKQAASTDGKHNIIVVNSNIPDSKAIYNMSVTEMELDQVQLGQQISTGKIQGMITFMDHGGDDGVTATEKTSATTAVDDNPYAMSLEDTGKFIVALTVWGFGGESDEDQFDVQFSDREVKSMITEFQGEVGAPATGVWDEATFVKAKEFVVNNYDDEEYLTDAQFKSFIGDMKNYYDGKITRDQAEDNMDGYIYDKKVNPINVPKEPDTIGFKAFTERFSEQDIFTGLMGYDGYTSAEVDAMNQVIFGGLSFEESKQVLIAAEVVDAEEFGETFPNTAEAPGQTLKKAMYDEFEEYLGNGETSNGSFSQSIYDGYVDELKGDYEFDASPVEMRQKFTQAFELMVAAGKGEIDEDTMDSKIEALATGE